MKLPRLAAQLIALGVWIGAVVGAIGAGAALGLSIGPVFALLLAAALVARFAEQRLMDASVAPQGDLRCSFCAKSQREVRKLIAGPTVYICDECIGLCNEILAEHGEKAPPAPPPENVFEPPAS